MNIYFKNIRAVNPYESLDSRMNLWLKDGIIQLCSNTDAEIDSDTTTIDGSALVCAPGFFDMHVHFREPGFEYKEDTISGATAAANGGFTGVVVMPNTEPAIDNPQVVEYIRQRAKGSLTDVHIAGAITQKREGKYISPLFELSELGVLYFTDDGSCVSNAEMMRKSFEYAATKDLLIAQHCEEHSLSGSFSMNESALSYKLGLKGYPAVAEDIIVNRDIMLAEYLGNRRYHVSHISSKGAVELVRKAKERGLRVTAEAAPHHFCLTEEVLVDYNTNHKMNPPLRGKDDVLAIINGLVDGTIDCIATDHAPHALHEKEVEYENAPCGIVGLETSLGLVLTNLYHSNIMSLSEIINKMSVNPRKLLKLNDIKFEVGEIANLTIFNPDEEWIVDSKRFQTKSKNSPFDGFRLKGKPKYTINNKQLIECKL